MRCLKVAKNADNDKTFVRISNNQIYQQLQELKSDVASIKDKLTESCNKTSTLQKLIMGAYGYVTLVLGWFVGHLIHG